MLEYKEIFCKNRHKKILQSMGLFMDVLWGFSSRSFLQVSGHCSTPHISTHAHQLRELITHSRLVKQIKTLFNFHPH